MRKYLVIIICALSVLCSCSGYKDVDLYSVNVNSVHLVSASKANVNVGLKVNNPTKRTFVITDIQGVLFKDNIPFANISLLEDAVIVPGVPSDAQINSRIEIIDPMSLLVMGLNINSWNIKEFTLDIKIVVKDGLVKKAFKFKKMPVDKVVKRLKL